MEKLRQKFLIECVSYLDLVDRSLQELRAAPPQDEVLGNLMRGAHSIKGGAGFFDLDRLVWLAGAMEEVSRGLQRGSLALSEEVISHLEESSTYLSDLVEAAMVGVDLVGGYEVSAGAKLKDLCAVH